MLIIFWIYEVEHYELVSSDLLIWFLENFVIPVWFYLWPTLYFYWLVLF